MCRLSFGNHAAPMQAPNSAPDIVLAWYFFGTTITVAHRILHFVYGREEFAACETCVVFMVGFAV
jgi:hypothetical protein